MILKFVGKMTDITASSISAVSRRITDWPARYQHRLIFLAILGVAIILRVLRLIHARVISPDGTGYIRDALAIGTEGLRSLFQSGFGDNFSVYPILLYLVDRLVGDPVLSGQLVSLFFGCLLIVPVYFLAKETMGPRAGLIAAFMAAVHPHLIRYSAEVLKDSMLFFFAITSVALALWGHRRKNYVVIFLAGLAAWATCLVRIYGIVVVASITVAIIVSGLPERRRWRSVAAELLLFTVPIPALGYLLFAVFVGAGNEHFFQTLATLFASIVERYSAVRSYRDVLLAGNPGVDPSYLNVITSYPWLSALREFFDVWVTAFTGLFFVLFLAGGYLGRASLLKRGPGLFVLTCAAMLMLFDILIVMTVFFLSKRHVMILVLVVLPWSALALDRFIQWYRERARTKYRIKSRMFYRIVSVAFLIWVVLALAFTSFLDPTIDKNYYRKAAGEYIKGIEPPNPTLLMGRSDGLLIFYSGGTGIVLDNAGTLEKTIAEKRPDFVVWDTAMAPLPEEISVLSDAGAVERIQTIEGTVDGESIVIYRVKKD